MISITERIIYPADNTIAVIIPCTDTIPIFEIARKDVPSGVPFLIVSVDDIPSDRTYRSAWNADFSNPDGYGIGHDAWFAEQEADYHV
jgi:hypothetical protein